MERFCKKAATDLERQRGREFGFSAEGCCVTDLTTVSTDVFEKLPVHNLDCERDLAIMDKIASRAAVGSNRKFTAKDDMTLYQAKITKIDKETKNSQIFLMWTKRNIFFFQLIFSHVIK